MMCNCKIGMCAEKASINLGQATPQKEIEKGVPRKGYCAMNSSPTQSILFEGFYTSVDEDPDASMNSDAVSIADTETLMESKSMGTIEEDDETSTYSSGIKIRIAPSNTNSHEIQSTRGLRLVDGRLQVVGFASESKTRINPPKPKIKAKTQKSFWSQVMFYIMK
jgi:hypothetical protein